MQIVLPISSYTQFYKKEEEYYPKPQIEIRGKPMIQVVIETLINHFPTCKFICIIEKENSQLFSLKNIINTATKGKSKVIERNSTSGALCSVLLGVEEIDKDDEMIVLNADQVIVDDLKKITRFFKVEEASAGVIVHKSLLPRGSFVRIKQGSKNEIDEVREKEVISDTCISGFYWFESGSSFIQYASEAIMRREETKGIYYLSAAINSAILNKKKVLAKEIDSNQYYSFYNKSLISRYEAKINSSEVTSGLVETQVVIPAAGLGSRFKKEGYQTPKPFLPLHGKTMIECVISNLTTRNSDVTILLQQETIDELSNKFIIERMNARIIPVKALTEGTACTVSLALNKLNLDKPLLIANSDQLVDFDVEEFIADALKRNLDGSILVFKDKDKNPKWSFAKLDHNNIVTDVAEKNPISDLATVGIYYFRRARNFQESVIEMIAENNRVNGEFYTCPVYNYMIRKGYKIGVFEVSDKNMHGLGTPKDYESYIENIQNNK